MNIVISNSSGVPIYEQICEQVKAQIIDETLSEGEMLPSIRSLAALLRVSSITTKRAYDELDAMGLTVSVPGKGRFVAKINHELLREEQMKHIEEHLKQATSIAKVYQVSKADFLEMVDLIWEEHDAKL